MITYVSQSFHVPSLVEVKTSFQARAEKISQFAHEKLQSVSMGIQVGLLDLGFGIVASELFDLIPGFGDLLADPELAAEYLEEAMGSFWETAVLAPVVEEVLFRQVIQGAFKKLAEKVLPDQDVTLFSQTMKLAVLVAVVATAVLFGLVHLGSGLGIVQVILATSTGIVYGILKEKYGLTASISAHMTNNAVAFGLARLGGL